MLRSSLFVLAWVLVSSSSFAEAQNVQSVNCSAQEQRALQSAVGAALNLIDQSKPAERYLKWFGGTDDRTILTVLWRLTGARESLEVLGAAAEQALDKVHAQNIVFDCRGCSSIGRAADTRPGSNKVNLCERFWGLKVSGSDRTDTQAGTLIHEAIHVAWGYITHAADGVDECRELACTDPEATLTNADSYAQLCEDPFVISPCPPR